MKSKLNALLLTIPMLLGACSSSNRVDMNAWKFSPANENEIRIGILQPVEHEALEQARLGFIEAVNENAVTNTRKVTFNYQNAGGVEADQNTLAKNLVASSDMTLGIGTGASQSLQAAALNSGNTNPIIFTAVTDAVDANLVDSNENPGQFITGSSDANPVEAQIDLIKECLPDATTIGIMYTQSETNSEVQANQAEAEALKQGLQVVRATCTDSSDIAAVANDLCGNRGIQALYVPTDNNLAAHFGPVKVAVEAFHILTVCGETAIMRQGGHITLSVDYFELGKKAGLDAAKIINGTKKPNEIPVETMSIEECEFVMCSANINAAGLTLPESITSKCTDVDPA